MEIAGLTILHFFWQGGLLLLVAWGLLFALRKKSAQSRYIACCLVMAAMAAAPAITAITISSQPPNTQHLTPNAPLTTNPTPNPQHLTPTPSNPQSPTPNPQSPTPNPQNASLLNLIAIGWLAGVAILTIRCLGGFVVLARLRFVGRSTAPEWVQAKFQSLVQRMGIKGSPQLFISTQVSVPTVIGALKGVVLLPASAISGMSPEMLETLLAHELAHVRRFDFIVNLLQTVVEIALFYHPAVWWLSNRIRQERENCCDDLVVATLEDRKIYALALSRVEELRMTSLALRADGGELLVRIRRILGETQMKSIASPATIALLAAALVLGPVLHSHAAAIIDPIQRDPLYAAAVQKEKKLKAKSVARERVLIVQNANRAKAEADKVALRRLVAAQRAIQASERQTALRRIELAKAQSEHDKALQELRLREVKRAIEVSNKDRATAQELRRRAEKLRAEEMARAHSQADMARETILNIQNREQRSSADQAKLESILKEIESARQSNNQKGLLELLNELEREVRRQAVRNRAVERPFNVRDVAAPRETATRNSEIVRELLNKRQAESREAAARKTDIAREYLNKKRVVEREAATRELKIVNEQVANSKDVLNRTKVERAYTDHVKDLLNKRGVQRDSKLHEDFAREFKLAQERNLNSKDIAKRFAAAEAIETRNRANFAREFKAAIQKSDEERKTLRFGEGKDQTLTNRLRDLIGKESLATRNTSRLGSLRSGEAFRLNLRSNNPAELKTEIEKQKQELVTLKSTPTGEMSRDQLESHQEKIETKLKQIKQLETRLQSLTKKR